MNETRLEADPLIVFLQIIQLCWRERKRIQLLLRAADVRAERGLVELEKNKERPGSVFVLINLSLQFASDALTCLIFFPLSLSTASYHL